METISLLAHYYQGVVKSLGQDLPLILGEVLSAKVQTKHNSKNYDLQIRSKVLQVESSRLLKTGESLQLRVTQVKNPVILKIVDPASREFHNNQQKILEQSRHLLLRQSLPNQKPLQSLFKQLLSLSSEHAPDRSHITDKVQKIATEFHQLIQAYQKVATPKHVRQAIESSGLFLESRLANQVLGQNTHLPVVDIKSLLLRLSQQLNQLNTTESTAPNDQNSTARQPATMNNMFHTLQLKTPGTPPGKLADPAEDNLITERKTVTDTQKQVTGEQTSNTVQSRSPVLAELRQQVDAGLSRIHIQQNNAVVSDTHPQAVWSMEIPVQDGKHIYTIGLTIHEDSRNYNSHKGKSWMTILELDLEHLGIVQVRLGLFDKEISASIWAEKSQTVKLIEANLEQLDRQLRGAGLKVNEIRCLHGRASPVNKYQPESLVDIQL